MPNDRGATWTSYGKAFGSSNSWRTKLWSSITLCQSRSKYARKEQWRRGKQSKEKQRGKQWTAAAVFFGTFGALPEVHFLHAVYRFKAQEVKNPTLQTVYDLELKRGRYGFQKTTAPGLRKFRTPLEQLSSEGHIFLISAPNCTRFEALDSWLPEIWNGI